MPSLILAHSVYFTVRVKMAQKRRERIVLQSFHEDITDDNVIEFTCSKCKHKVKSKPRIQSELSTGGVGHYCDKCNTYLALFQCPNCKSTITVDDTEWDRLAKPEGVDCPSCKVNLYRESEEWRPNVIISGILLPGLNSWSNSKDEEKYLSIIKRYLDSEKIKIFTVRHHSVSVRMKSAKESLEYLNSNEWYSISAISNNSGAIKKDKTYKTPHDHSFHKNLFGFINNLRSALDIFTQEVATIFSPELCESKIDFRIVEQIFRNTTPELIQTVSKFRNSESYDYLNRFRNVLQHRRIPLMVTAGSHDTSQLDTIRPAEVRVKAIIKLPSDPYLTESFENINSYSIMLFPKINELYSAVEQFILEIYGKINPYRDRDGHR